MEVPTREEILSLIEPGDGPRVTIYLPTHRAGPNTRQDPIRLKNLLTQAEDGLVEQGLRRTIAKDLLEPAWSLEEDYDFWQQQADGLALFIDETGRMRYYRVPTTFREFVLVAPRYHLKPLLPLISEDNIFFLMAISINETRVLECTQHSQDEVKVPGMPRSMADALWADQPENQIQFRAFYTGSSGDIAQFHGAGGTEIDVKDELLRYFREVDAALAPFLREHRRPLMLACVGYLGPIYREANTYNQLIETQISGNPEQARPEELREEAWRAIEPMFRARREEALARYRQQAGTGLTTNDPAQAALAAIEGRIDTVFVQLGMQHWGRIDAETHTVQRHEEAQPGDQDLLDLTAVHALVNSGTVYAVHTGEEVEQSGVAAIFRY
jgi:hypothetical protein